MRTPPGADWISQTGIGRVAPYGGLAGGSFDAAGGLGLGRVGQAHRYDRERCNFRGSERSQRTVKNLSSGNRHCTRSYQDRADGCEKPASDQEESLSHCNHRPCLRVSMFPTPC